MATKGTLNRPRSNSIASYEMGLIWRENGCDCVLWSVAKWPDDVIGLLPTTFTANLRRGVYVWCSHSHNAKMSAMRLVSSYRCSCCISASLILVPVLDVCHAASVCLILRHFVIQIRLSRPRQWVMVPFTTKCLAPLAVDSASIDQGTTGTVYLSQRGTSRRLQRGPTERGHVQRRKNTFWNTWNCDTGEMSKPHNCPCSWHPLLGEVSYNVT
jgi:hypothetical protein